MGGVSKAKLRPLGIKNTNTINNNNHNNNNDNASLGCSKTNRKLSNKNSADLSVSINPVHYDTESFKENVAPNEVGINDYGNTEILNNAPVQQPLTEENLKQLQNEIVGLEHVLFPCEHFLCGLENRCQLHSPRLWLLFELEMSLDHGVTNLRNTCYHEHVYEAVCSPWKVQNCIQQIPPNAEPFPLEQLMIPEIELIKESDLKNVTVQIGDLVEKKKIPPTSLSSQNRQEIFDSTPVNTTAIVRHRNTSEMSDELEKDYEETSLRCKKKPKISALERKLALIGGMSPPKLKK